MIAHSVSCGSGVHDWRIRRCARPTSGHESARPCARQRRKRLRFGSGIAVVSVHRYEKGFLCGRALLQMRGARVLVLTSGYTCFGALILGKQYHMGGWFSSGGGDEHHRGKGNR